MLPFYFHVVAACRVQNVRSTYLSAISGSAADIAATSIRRSIDWFLLGCMVYESFNTVLL